MLTGWAVTGPDFRFLKSERSSCGAGSQRFLPTCEWQFHATLVGCFTQIFDMLNVNRQAKHANCEQVGCMFSVNFDLLCKGLAFTFLKLYIYFFLI